MADDPDPGGTGEHLHKVDVTDEQASPVSWAWLSRLARHALTLLAIAENAELSIVLVEPERMAELKASYFGINEPTDVLAFPMDERTPSGVGPYVLGDVVLCPEIARRQAVEFRRSTDDEIALLLVHGILHLLGHDHAEDDERERMQAEEERILGTFAGASA